MERLNSKSLPAFLKTAGVAVVMFGAAEVEATLEQAEKFALLWADHVAEHIVGVRFGYIDGTANWEARDMFGVDELPTTLAIRNGAVTHRFEGVHSYSDISLALHPSRPARVQSHAHWRRHEVAAGSQRSAA